MRGHNLNGAPNMKYEALLQTTTRLDIGSLSRLAESTARFVIGSDVWALLEERRQILLDRMAQGGTPIYGANTGVGAMKTYRLSLDGVGAFNDRLVRDHAAGFGPFVDVRLSRLAMAVRIIELAQGGSGISLPAYQTLVAVYNAGLAPTIPSLGSVGEGDITLLAHMARALQGTGKMWKPDGRLVSADRALKAAGIPKLVLQARDGLALIGSNAWTASLVIEALCLWRSVRDAAVPITSLSWLAWRANPASLQEEVLGRVGPDVAAVGREVWSWMVDTPMTPRDIQDPLAWRCAPHVFGAADQMARELGALVETLVHSPRDNPVVLATGDVVSNGNFDATDLALRIDGLRGALVRVMGQQAQRTAKLLNHHYSGLTPGLAHRFGDAGLSVLDFNVSALMTEAQLLAQGPLMQWGDVAEGIEDYGSLASVAAVRLLKLIRIWQTLTATEWVVAARGIAVQKIGVRGTLSNLAHMGSTSQKLSATPYENVQRLEKKIADGGVAAIVSGSV